MPDQNQPNDLNQTPPRPVLTTEEVPMMTTPQTPLDPTVPTDTPPPPPPPIIPDTTDIPPPPPGPEPIDTIVPQTTTTTDTSSSFDLPPVVGTPTVPPRKKFGGRKVISTILGLLLLVGGVGVGVTLVKQQQDIRERAATNVCGSVERAGCEAQGKVCEIVNNKVTCVSQVSNVCGSVERAGCEAQGKVCEIINNQVTCSVKNDCTSVERAGCEAKGETCEIVNNKVTCVAETSPGKGCSTASAGTCANKDLGESCGTNGTCGITGAKDASDRPICKCEADFDDYCTASSCDVGGAFPGCYVNHYVSNDADGPPPTTLAPGKRAVQKSSLGLQSCGAEQIDVACGTQSTGESISKRYTQDCGVNPPPPPITPPATNPPGSGASARCLNVKAYDTNFNPLTQDQLKALKVGDKVRFAVAGTSTGGGSFDKAKFKINSTNSGEVTTKKPSSEEFYYEFTVPAGTTSFNITAQIHHTTLGWSN